MHKLVHITDPHIVSGGRRVMGFDPVRRLRDVIGTIVRDHADACACTITGDLTDAGDTQSYALLQDMISQLPMPVYLTLGNHDGRDAYLTCFPAAPRNADGFIQFVFDVGDTLCVVLDTLDTGHAATGALCGLRLGWLEETLRAYASRPVMILMHHPPTPIGMDWFEPMLLGADDAKAFRRIVAAAGNVVHIAFGHVHAAFAGLLDGIPVSCSRGTCHKILDGSRADVATYEDAPPAFDVLIVMQDGIRVEAHDPGGTGRLIAREFATPDGKGRIEFIEAART